MIHRPHSVLRFDREVTPDYLTEWTDRVAARKQVNETGSRSAVIFEISREYLALPTKVFQEVVEHCVVRPLPHRRGEVLSGMANVRGELLLCVSLSVLLGLGGDNPAGREQPPARARLLICNHKGDRLAFRADEVHGVRRYDTKDLREVPATVARSPTAAYIAGILPWAGRTVGCLDPDRLFSALNQSLG